jgi:hypothetical protein
MCIRSRVKKLEGKKNKESGNGNDDDDDIKYTERTKRKWKETKYCVILTAWNS